MGAVAQVIQTEIDQARQSEIVNNYESMLEDLDALAEAARFWGAVNNHPEFTKFISNIQEELSETRERWDDIKPNDFRDSQSRVRAIKFLTRTLTSRPEDVAEALKAKKRLVYNYEIENEIFLRAAGFELDDQPQDAADEGEGGPEGGTEAHEAVTLRTIAEAEAGKVTIIIPEGWSGVERDKFDTRLAALPVFKHKGGRTSQGKRTWVAELRDTTEEDDMAIDNFLDAYVDVLEEIRFD